MDSKGQSYVLPGNKVAAAAQTNATNWFLNTTELPKIPTANGILKLLHCKTFL